MDDRDSIPGEGKDLFFLFVTQPPIQWVTVILSRVKRPERESDHSPPSNADVKIARS
jgi:hypothetical protein